MPVMAFDHWTEVLSCPNCGLTGVASLSEPNQVDAAIIIDTISDGLKAVSSEYGETFLVKVVTDQPRKLGLARKAQAAGNEFGYSLSV